MKFMKNLKEIIEENLFCLIYFSNEKCNVCKVLKPKLQNLLENKFPKIKFQTVNIEEKPEVIGQFEIFTIPTVIFFYDKKREFTLNRYMSLFELEKKLERFYNFFYNSK